MVNKPSTLKSVLISKLSFKPPVTQDPRTFGSKTKNVILICVGLCASTAGFASTIYFPGKNPVCFLTIHFNLISQQFVGLPYVTADLNAPYIATTLTAALYVLMMGIAPVFWAMMSDNWHVRRIILFASMVIFAVSSLGCAFVNNIWGLVVLRCVQAVGSSCGQSVGAGVISDCYPVEERGAAFGKFFFGLFFGPLLGPIIGGFLIMSDLSWRATFWFCVAFAGSIGAALFFFFPETFRDDLKWDNYDPSLASTLTFDELYQPPVQDMNREKTNASNTNDIQADHVTTKESEIAIKNESQKGQQHPLAAFVLLKHPFIMIASLISGIAFGCMFAIETLVPDLYEEYYGFNSWQTGKDKPDLVIFTFLVLIINP